MIDWKELSNEIRQTLPGRRISHLEYVLHLNLL